MKKHIVLILTNLACLLLVADLLGNSIPLILIALKMQGWVQVALFGAVALLDVSAAIGLFLIANWVITDIFFDAPKAEAKEKAK